MEKQESLTARLQAGERAAAFELVDKYYKRIYLYMRRLGHNRENSEDLTQECFLQAWNHIGQLRSGRALNSWLYRIAGNVSRLYWRKHKYSSEISIDEIDLSLPAKDGSGQVEDREELLRLKEAVDKLPVKLKQAVVLHYMQHLTIAEAAEALGIRDGTFKSRLFRALKILRKEL